MYHIAKVSIQPIYRDMIQSPTRYHRLLFQQKTLIINQYYKLTAQWIFVQQNLEIISIGIII